MVANNEVQKCDCLIVNYKENILYLIELKGKDLYGAITQISQTKDCLNNHPIGFSVNARIVLTKVPVHDLRSSEYISLERRLKRMKDNIRQQTNQLKEVL